MRADIVPGAVSPDFELQDHRGKQRVLSEFQEQPQLLTQDMRAGFRSLR